MAQHRDRQRQFWALFCAVLNRPDLCRDPRFARAPDRAANRAALRAVLLPIIQARPRAAWISDLAAAGVPCGEIRTVAEVCENPQLTGRGQVQATRHPAAGEVRHVASAIRFDDAPPPPARPAPLLGEHRDELLAEWLGLDAAAIAALAGQGAFGPPA